MRQIKCKQINKEQMTTLQRVQSFDRYGQARAVSHRPAIDSLGPGSRANDGSKGDVVSRIGLSFTKGLH